VSCDMMQVTETWWWCRVHKKGARGSGVTVCAVGSVDEGVKFSGKKVESSGPGVVEKVFKSPFKGGGL
jgi:hypothetical protein